MLPWKCYGWSSRSGSVNALVSAALGRENWLVPRNFSNTGVIKCLIAEGSGTGKPKDLSISGGKGRAGSKCQLSACQPSAKPLGAAAAKPQQAVLCVWLS